jgi:hypothetical protein
MSNNHAIYSYKKVIGVFTAMPDSLIIFCCIVGYELDCMRRIPGNKNKFNESYSLFYLTSIHTR